MMASGHPLCVIIMEHSILLKVCQNAHLLFLCTKPRLSQAGALLLPKDFVSLSITFYTMTKLLQKSEMRKDIVIELSYKGFG